MPTTTARSDVPRPITVAVDVMGTDRGPGPMIRGVIDAVEADESLRCIVVGSAQALSDHLDGDRSDRISKQEASETVGMADEPAAAVRSMRDSSTMSAMTILRSGRADAVVSAANTGAVVLTAAAVLRRLSGVFHPALGTPLTWQQGGGAVLVDCGASIHREAAWLEQYAHMGVALARAVTGTDRPKVGILANGSEPTKGDPAIREAHRRLGASHLDYVGLLEPDALYRPELHVIVTDGLLGNVVLKTTEATVHAISSLSDGQSFRREAPRIGRGGVLLGVDGVVVKAHGTGTAEGCRDALRLAAPGVTGRLLEHTKQAIVPLPAATA